MTVPFEKNIDDRHKMKTEKYSHFLQDINSHKTYLTAFEIGARGYISQGNHANIKKLHKFMKPSTKLTKFKENISAMTIYSSYHIFNFKIEKDWEEPPFLNTPFL